MGMGMALVVLVPVSAADAGSGSGGLRTEEKREELVANSISVGESNRKPRLEPGTGTRTRTRTRTRGDPNETNSNDDITCFSSASTVTPSTGSGASASASAIPVIVPISQYQTQVQGSAPGTQTHTHTQTLIRTNAHTLNSQATKRELNRLVRQTLRESTHHPTAEMKWTKPNSLPETYSVKLLNWPAHIPFQNPSNNSFKDNRTLLEGFLEGRIRFVRLEDLPPDLPGPRDDIERNEEQLNAPLVNDSNDARPRSLHTTPDDPTPDDPESETEPEPEPEPEPDTEEPSRGTKRKRIYK